MVKVTDSGMNNEYDYHAKFDIYHIYGVRVNGAESFQQVQTLDRR